MAGTYRPITSGERRAALAVLDAAYPIISRAHAAEIRERVTAEQLRGLFDGDELVAVGRLLPLTVWLNGREVACTGVASLATLPERRRRGYMKALVAGALAEVRERAPLSCLYPFDFEFYARLGWAVIDEKRLVRIPPAALRPRRTYERGHVDRVEASLEILHLHREWGARYNLTTVRDRYWLEHYLINGWSFAHPRKVFLWRPQPGAAPEGYAVLTFENERRGIGGYRETLWVCDFAYTSERARTGLFGFLADFDSQTRTIELEVASDDRLLYELSAPDAAEVSIKASAMARVVNVRALLDGAPVAGVDRDVVFEVVDPVCPWNQKRWRAAVSGGAISITESGDDPAAIVDIGALTQLVCGAVVDPHLELLAGVAGNRTPYHCDHY